MQFQQKFAFFFHSLKPLKSTGFGYFNGFKAPIAVFAEHDSRHFPMVLSVGGYAKSDDYSQG